MEAIRATYRLRVSAERARGRAEALALEQTVELPREAVREPFVEKEVLPRVVSVEPDAGAEGAFRATLAFPEAVAAGCPAQLLNVLFGNSALQEDAELVDLALPSATARALGGPRRGIAGLRAALGAGERPLTCVALKPMGLGPDALASLAGTFVEAGIDVVKDDHGLADQPFAPFEARAEACQRAVEAAARRSGRTALYAPSLVGTPSRVHAQLRFARERGVRAALVAPALLGLPLLAELAREAPDIALLAHPALGGVTRIAPEVLWGTLFRAYGADAAIFPHAGGRFGVGAEACARVAERLRGPAGGEAALRAALPVPAGGMSVERAGELVRFYGRDVMLLVGGSLYAAGDGLAERTRAFVEAVRRAGEAEGAPDAARADGPAKEEP